MSVTIGDTMGGYEILSLLGKGGMGEVYRARDSKLGREVAIKVLASALADNEEFLARFEREARLLASLNHPNIATLHGLEVSGDTRFLVMELVPGDTLQDRIKMSALGRLPLEEALAIFQQIAEALEAAHEKGVVHRDLKPPNIKLTPDDRVKVLDFGLAKRSGSGSASGDFAESPTLTRAATESGMLLGTAAYMSPEQARGKTVDRRTDIWAFGCCLFETLTGRPTFGGETLSDTLAAILKQDPHWESLPESTPASVRQVLRRCLAKDPHRRYRDVWDVRLQIEEARSEPEESEEDFVVAPEPSAWSRTAPWLAMGFFALLAAALGIPSWTATDASTPGPVAKLRLSTPPLQGTVAVSRDGSALAYPANGWLYVRPMDQLDAKALDGTDGATNPFFSPNGEWVGFFADNKLKKVEVAGGTPVTLCDASAESRGRWGPDDRIYFRSPANGPGIRSVPAAGGSELIITEPEDGDGHWPLEVLPGGKSLLVATTGAKDVTIGAVSLESGEHRDLVQNASWARYASSGHLIFGRAGTLRAVPFDPGECEVTGAEVPVLEGVGGAVEEFELADNGTLVFVPGSAKEANTLVWVDRSGNAQKVSDVQRGYEAPRISPDGRRIALSIDTEGNNDVWVYDIVRGTLTRLTLSESDESGGFWSPDGGRVVFLSDRDGKNNLYWKPADGSGPTERLTKGNEDHWPLSWSADGRFVVFAKEDRASGFDLWTLPMEGDGEPEPFLATPFNELDASISPDSRWVAYVSDESGRPEVYVRAFAASGAPGGRWLISTGGGTHPVWRPDGKEIFYRTIRGGGMMSVPLDATQELSPGRPTKLFDGTFEKGQRTSRNYDISPDGERFLMVQGEGESRSQEIVVVLNWFRELERLVPSH